MYVLLKATVLSLIPDTIQYNKEQTIVISEIWLSQKECKLLCIFVFFKLFICQPDDGLVAGPKHVALLQ